MPAEKSSGWPFGMALASSQARASARKAASSGVSSKSTAPQTRTRSSREPDLDGGAFGDAGPEDLGHHVLVGRVLLVGAPALDVVALGDDAVVPSSLPEPEVGPVVVAAEARDLARKLGERRVDGGDVVLGDAVAPAEHHHVANRHQLVRLSASSASTAGVDASRRAHRVDRNRSTPSITLAVRSDGKTSKACWAPLHLGVEHRLRRTPPAAGSTKARASSTGASVSRSPWTTKNGGASAWTWCSGEAVVEPLGLLGDERLHHHRLEEPPEDLRVAAEGAVRSVKS